MTNSVVNKLIHIVGIPNSERIVQFHVIEMPTPGDRKIIIATETNAYEYYHSPRFLGDNE